MNQTIAKIINALGDDATFTPGDGLTDDRIELGDYEIQVAGRGLILNLWDEESGETTELATFTDVDDLIDRLIG